MNYQDFIKNKIAIAKIGGFEGADSEIPSVLKPHQRDIVKWAILGGCRAIFASFGLGKSVIQLSIMKIISEREKRKTLIIAPLGVKQEFVRDGRDLLGMDLQYVRTDAEAKAAGRYCITNYERVRDGQLNPEQFAAVTLDEASILRGFGTKTYQEFLPLCRNVKYKFVATATPSPNEYKELIHYAGYLGIMDTGEALTRFFQRDSEKAGNLTLYPHMEREFWMWISSWAVFLNRPSDLGYSDEGYDLPPLKVHWHRVDIDHMKKIRIDRRNGQMEFFHDAARSLPDAAREKRETIPLRVAKMLEIVKAEPEKSFILWHHLEDERKAIQQALPEAVAIWGEQDIETREQSVIDFSDGKIKYFATKPELSGSGCNFQRHCADAIFVGINYQFNDFVQAVHRVYRFLQMREVNIHIIYADSEDEIKNVLLQKWKRHDELLETMAEIIRKYGLSADAIRAGTRRALGINRQEFSGRHYTAINNDCVDETSRMAENSIDLIHTSIPFSNHYEYTPNYNDFGHNLNNEKFFQQMDFLTPELFRILKPGRVAAIHVKDRILFGAVEHTGAPIVDPFSDETVAHFRKHGFLFFGRITIETDVVRENNQTYRLGWTEQCKDGTKMGVGCPEYILLFRKLPTDTSRAYADEPVAKSKEDYTRAQWQIDAHGYWRSSGDRLVGKAELATAPTDKLQKLYRQFSRENVYSYEEHVELAKKLDAEGKLPATFMVVAPGSWSDEVWDDINRMRTLNTTQSQRRAQMHVCPLQLDIVERLINRYSNPGDTVFDPFAGLFTVPKLAVDMGRRGVGVELNLDYFRDGVGYMRAAEAQVAAPTLFDLLDEKNAV